MFGWVLSEKVRFCFKARLEKFFNHSHGKSVSIIDKFRVCGVDPKYRIAGEEPPKSAKRELSYYKVTIRDNRDRRIVSAAYVIYPGKKSKSFGMKKDFGHIALTPNSDMKKFKQEISELIC